MTSRTAAARAQAEEMVVRAASERGASVQEEVDFKSYAQPIMEEWKAKLTQQTEKYVEYSTALARGKKPQGEGIADPFTLSTPLYNWWDMIMAGPFQPISPGAGGPFLPNKVIRAGEPAFMLCALWRNPAPIAWAINGPSAATVMSAYDFRIRLETCDLTDCVNGPDFGPVDLAPIGGGFLNIFLVPLAFPNPPQGRPHLYELNMTADVTGPVGGLPFAGYSTWLFDPDLEPPFLFLPPIPPQLQHDIPARLLVYTA